MQQQSLIRLKRTFWMSYHQHHLTDADLSHSNPPESQRWQLNISLSSQMMNTGVMDELTRNNKPVILFWLPAKYYVSQVGELRMLARGEGRGTGGRARLAQCELTWEERWQTAGSGVHGARWLLNKCSRSPPTSFNWAKLRGFWLVYSKGPL